MNRQEVLDVYEAEKGLPDQHSDYGLCGKFVSLHEAHYRAQMTEMAVRTNAAALTTVMHKRGMEDTWKGLSVLFGSRCSWVKDKTVSFLGHDGTWGKHIHPFLDAPEVPTKEGGEFSEFRAPRPGGKGARRVW
jgi:hypothetical protein